MSSNTECKRNKENERNEENERTNVKEIKKMKEVQEAKAVKNLAYSGQISGRPISINGLIGLFMDNLQVYID